MRIGENSIAPIEALYQRARTSPNGVAFIVGDDKWKYGWLAAQVERVARGLAGRGIRKGNLIALHMPNRPEFVVAVSAPLPVAADVHSPAVLCATSGTTGVSNCAIHTHATLAALFGLPFMCGGR